VICTNPSIRTTSASSRLVTAKPCTGRRLAPRKACLSSGCTAARHGELAVAYARLLANPDVQVRDAAAQAWCEWEDTHVSLAPDWAPSPRYADPGLRTVCRNCFLADGEVLAGMPRLESIPGILIHGSYDVSSPRDTAWAIHRAWPGSELVVLGDTGHGGASLWSQHTASLDSFRSLRQP
jgi:proline iminopeptidase